MSYRETDWVPYRVVKFTTKSASGTQFELIGAATRISGVLRWSASQEFLPRGRL